MTAQTFIGCDPGKKGSICRITPDPGLVEFMDMDNDPSKILDFLTFYTVRAIMIEDVHSIHGTSAKSNFEFGRSVERINLLATLTNYPLDRVKPKAWQKAVGVPKVPSGPALKKAVAQRCKELYPTHVDKFFGPKGGLMDGRTDALMIAHYCYLTYKV